LRRRSAGAAVGKGLAGPGRRPGVKYFSGTATYTKRFTVTASAKAGGKRVYLDLGRAEVLAEVKVNGKDLGTLRKPPFRVDVTDAVHAGNNDLEVRLTNLWPNRLIGDEQLPPENEYARIAES
jgi:beta-galactosidase/beta-glucuronidase